MSTFFPVRSSSAAYTTPSSYPSGSGVGVAGGAGVGVAVGSGGGVAVGSGTGVAVAVGAGTRVGVAVGTGVGVGVAVGTGVGVAVGSGAGVAVGAEAGVAVGCGGGTGVGVGSSPLQALSTSATDSAAARNKPSRHRICYQPAFILKLVGAARIELATSCSQSRRASAALRPGVLFSLAAPHRGRRRRRGCGVLVMLVDGVTRAAFAVGRCLRPFSRCSW